jgi:Protein of unknown function DUF86
LAIRRNQLIHGYAGIDDDVVWSFVQTDLPDLLSVCEQDEGGNFCAPRAGACDQGLAGAVKR